MAINSSSTALEAIKELEESRRLSKTPSNESQTSHDVTSETLRAAPKTGDGVAGQSPEPNLIGHYVVKIYAHDDCPDEDRQRLKNAFSGLHDEVESVFSAQVEGEDWEHDIQYEVTNEMPWDGTE